jgi:formylglycine-generating enzyme required for sulfatase activity
MITRPKRSVVTGTFESTSRLLPQDVLSRIGRALKAYFAVTWFVATGFFSGAANAQAETTAHLKTNLVIDVGSGVRMEFLLVEPGSFIMGSDKSPLLDQKPAHRVTIKEPFYLGRYEVTQEQWQAVMNDMPSIHKGPKFPGSARCPVENVSWNYVQSFLARLNEKVSAGYTFRLPAEAEWEYACRAGTTNEDTDVGAIAWFSTNANGQPHPVGEKLPNAWGFYDMHGNVWEWCGDIYKAYPGGELPAGVASGVSRVLRGGAYNSLAKHVSSAYRHDLEPDDCFRYYGFRCVAAGKLTSQ